MPFVPLARIKDVVPNAEFHVYGEGPAVPALTELADKVWSGRPRGHSRKRDLGEMAGIMRKRGSGHRAEEE